jgi:GAF domain-containing protein
VVSDIETIYNETESGTERNYVFVPLFVLSEGVGMYIIYTSKPKNEFTKQDLELLNIIAEQAAIAIENFRINKKLRNLEKILKKHKNRFNVFSKNDANV